MRARSKSPRRARSRSPKQSGGNILGELAGLAVPLGLILSRKAVARVMNKKKSPAARTRKSPVRRSPTKASPAGPFNWRRRGTMSGGGYGFGDPAPFPGAFGPDVQMGPNNLINDGDSYPTGWNGGGKRRINVQRRPSPVRLLSPPVRRMSSSMRRTSSPARRSSPPKRASSPRRRTIKQNVVDVMPTIFSLPPRHMLGGGSRSAPNMPRHHSDAVRSVLQAIGDLFHKPKRAIRNIFESPKLRSRRSKLAP